jgi:hypothetical protein
MAFLYCTCYGITITSYRFISRKPITKQKTKIYSKRKTNEPLIHYYAVIVKNPKTKAMKKIFLLSVILLLSGWNVTIGQVATQSNPIPSYDVPVVNETIIFQEQPGNGTNEKRDGTVVITSTSDNTNEEIFATVLFTKKGSGEVLGPYTINLNAPLTVSFSKGLWSASVSTPSAVKASVWTSKNNKDTSSAQDLQ